MMFFMDYTKNSCVFIGFVLTLKPDLTNKLRTGVGTPCPGQERNFIGFHAGVVILGDLSHHLILMNTKTDCKLRIVCYRQGHH